MLHARATRIAALTMLTLGMVGLTGCQSAKVQQALRTQNQELQRDLDQTRAALDATGAERDRLAAQLDAAQKKIAQPPKPAPAVAPRPAASANTAFSGIAGIESEQNGQTVTVRVPGDVLFASGRVTLKSTAKHTLAQIASVIKRKYAGNTLRIEGFTDTDPIRKSKWKDNLELSLERAAAVERYLEHEGINKDRMYSAGFGDSRPQSTKTKSRRVEIVVLLNQ